MRKKKKVTAIIPAYNEEKNIEKVLIAVSKSNINEIIVVDDYSTDKTSDIVKKFKKIRYLRNKENKGKGYSMDRGVRAAKNEIIFFSDADLNGLTPKIVDSIISPVRSGKYEMFIGLRKKPYLLFLIKLGFKFNSIFLSGERCLTKKLWNKVPRYYKNNFKIETGLNYYAEKNGRMFGYEMFNYRQIIKEKKYPFLKATSMRWKMNFDILLSTFKYRFFD